MTAPDSAPAWRQLFLRLLCLAAFVAASYPLSCGPVTRYAVRKHDYALYDKINRFYQPLDHAITGTAFEKPWRSYHHWWIGNGLPIITSLEFENDPGICYGLSPDLELSLAENSR
jgi:hypothetical protein